MSEGKTVVTETQKINVHTGQVDTIYRNVWKQVRANRFVLMVVGNKEWRDALKKVNGQSFYFLNFVQALEYVSFGDGILNLSENVRKDMQAEGIDMSDSAIWRCVRNLEKATMLIRIGRGQYRVNQHFFNYGKSTKWVESPQTGDSRQRVVSDQEISGNGLSADEG